MLDLEDRSVFKAATALAGGVARRGETCGALTGAIMGICQLVGREEFADGEQYLRAMETCDQMYMRFKQDVGHTICREIHKILYGKSFDFYEEEDREAFRAAGGYDPEGCPGVCQKAARIAARIIIDLKESNPPSRAGR
jgi:C_GCAxxG_C_C family probable redox protein